MGHPLSPPRGWSYALGVGVDAHGEGGALPERGPQAGETGGPERQGPRARAGAGLDPGLPSPPKDAVRPLPALPCFGTLAGFPTPAPKAPGEKLQVSLGRGRPESSPCFAAWPEPPPSLGRRGSRGEPWAARHALPGPAAPPSRACLPLAHAPRSPTLNRAAASLSQWTAARFTEEKIMVPRALWSQPGRCWQSGDSAPMLRSVLSLRTYTEAG